MQNLRFNLLPLGPIIQQQKLDLPDQPFLTFVDIILLHLKRPFHISQKQVSVIQLLIRLLRPRINHPTYTSQVKSNQSIRKILSESIFNVFRNKKRITYVLT